MKKMENREQRSRNGVLEPYDLTFVKEWLMEVDDEHCNKEVPSLESLEPHSPRVRPTSQFAIGAASNNNKNNNDDNKDTPCGGDTGPKQHPKESERTIPFYSCVANPINQCDCCRPAYYPKKCYPLGTSWSLLRDSTVVRGRYNATFAGFIPGSRVREQESEDIGLCCLEYIDNKSHGEALEEIKRYQERPTCAGASRAECLRGVIFDVEAYAKARAAASEKQVPPATEPGQPDGKPSPDDDKTNSNKRDSKVTPRL